MKILALSGSPHKHGNNATLIREILRGAHEMGHTGELVHLYDLNMKGCIACGSCKKQIVEYCIHPDGLTSLIPKLVEADCLIVGSPVYMGQITGVTKTFIDRCYTFLGEDFSIRHLAGKKLITVVNYAAPDETFKDVTGYLDRWLVSFMKLSLVGSMNIGNLGAEDDAMGREDLIRRAYELGKQIS